MNNIFQAVSETDLDAILGDNMTNIVVIMFSSKTCGPCMNIKPSFIRLAKANVDSTFIYIDVTNYKDITRKYTNEVTGTPKFVYYFNNQEVASVSGANEKYMVDTLYNLKDRLEKKRKQYFEQQSLPQQSLQQSLPQSLPQQSLPQQSLPQQSLQQSLPQQSLQQSLPQQSLPQQSLPQQSLPQQSLPQQSLPQQSLPQQSLTPDNLFIKKASLLKKLFDLTKSGVKLTNSYDLDSEYDEMLWEYNLQTNPHSIKVNQEYVPTEVDIINNNNNELELLKKQEQLKKIQELNQLNQLLQMQQMQKIYRLEQLKNLQKARIDNTQNIDQV